MSVPTDVVVVGAGLAGLSAAHRLHAKGIRVVVLEASDRVGGRTRSENIDGSTVDFGAEWLGARHTNLQALIRELGLTTEPARMIGRPILWRGVAGERIGRSLPIRDEVTAAKLLWRISRLSRGLDPRRPWLDPRATQWDQTTFSEWLHENGARGDLYRYFSGMVGMLTGTSADELSLLQVLWWCARGGGPIAMVWTTFASRVTGGTQSIALALTADLGEAVQTNSTATRIVHGEDGAAVHTASGNIYHCQRVILTGSLDTKAPIDFEPALPTELTNLEELHIPPSVKVTALLPGEYRPRHVLALGGNPLGGAWRNGPRVTGFALPGHENATDDALIADLAACYRLRPDELHDPQIYRWSEHQAIGGCDIGFHPGQLTRHGPHLRTSHDRIDFAGAERSSWPNNMEGAVESGNRAAAAATRLLA